MYNLLAEIMLYASLGTMLCAEMQACLEVGRVGPLLDFYAYLSIP